MASMNSSGESSDLLGTISVCNFTLRGNQYYLYTSEKNNLTFTKSEATRFCMPHTDETDDGAALYVAVVLMILAIGIALLIGMTAFKRKRYEEWDRQAGNYLTTMYKRRYQRDREALRNSMSIPVNIAKSLAKYEACTRRLSHQLPLETIPQNMMNRMRSNSLPFTGYPHSECDTDDGITMKPINNMYNASSSVSSESKVPCTSSIGFERLPLLENVFRAATIPEMASET